jgi:hypothetical protein
MLLVFLVLWWTKPDTDNDQALRKECLLCRLMCWWYWNYRTHLSNVWVNKNRGSGQFSHFMADMINSWGEGVIHLSNFHSCQGGLLRHTLLKCTEFVNVHSITLLYWFGENQLNQTQDKFKVNSDVYTNILCSEKPYILTCLSDIFVYCQWYKYIM